MDHAAPAAPLIRLNRYLAQCGLGARRKCDELIRTGHVFVNGEKVTSLGTKIAPSDSVEYRGRSVAPLRRLEYWAYHKPAALMVTKHDPEGRATIFEALAGKGIDVRQCNYVGRLDFMSEGLLLLTSDGALIHALTHPRYHIKKTYRVLLDRQLAGRDAGRLLEGIESDGQILHAGRVEQLAGNWCEVDLYEGKNRQLHRMFEACSYRIERLVRTRFASVRLGDLAAGAVRPLTEREVAALKAAGFPAKKSP